MQKKQYLIIGAIAFVLIIATSLGLFLLIQKSGQLFNFNFLKRNVSVNSFDECEKAGYLIAESYPRICIDPNGKTFT